MCGHLQPRLTSRSPHCARRLKGDAVAHLRHAPPSRGGFTLFEALLTAALLSIISLGITQLYTASLKMYMRGQREATSRDKAALALERMMPEIQEAYNVDYPGPSLIVLTLPMRGADGRYSIDPTTKALLSGKEVTFYQADQTGVIGTTGHYIWRAERPTSSSTWTSKKVIMDDVEDLSFTYAPSVTMLELVQAAITVGQGEDPGYFNRTEVAEVWIRNH
jgi:hypothetical protein